MRTHFLQHAALLCAWHRDEWHRGLTALATTRAPSRISNVSTDAGRALVERRDVVTISGLYDTAHGRRIRSRLHVSTELSRAVQGHTARGTPRLHQRLGTGREHLAG